MSVCVCELEGGGVAAPVGPVSRVPPRVGGARGSLSAGGEAGGSLGL